ncbi:hypothetical protein F7725_017986, partial [Dissostichus mawsoni]
MERGERQSDTSDSETTDVRKINQQPFAREGRYDPNSKEEVEKRKKVAREKVLKPLSGKEDEISIDDVFPPEKGLGFPRRPPWSYEMTRENLLKREEKSQLWRVLEMSDVILLIVDIRHPFPPSLYNYITGELGKQVILVLNKADLCPPPLVIAWKHYMTSQFPHLQIQKIRRDAGAEQMDGEQLDDGLETVLVEHQTDIAMEMNSPSQELYKDGVLTIGCIGFPNVGKSSVINSLVARKVVSVSRTPGHTKYFQTYYLTPTVKLCDCPGLILAGIYPVSQLQEPYSSVGYLCERTPTYSVLKLKHPSLVDSKPHLGIQGSEDMNWTAWDHGQRGEAIKRPKLLVSMFIEQQTASCEHWENHPDLPEIIALQGRTTTKEEGMGERDDEEDGESSTEPEDERDRDADDEDGDDEDEGFAHPKPKEEKPSGFTVNMFNVLRENEC